MARHYEIKMAFNNSIVHEESGRRIVRTADFVRELAAVNHHWSLREANRWIEHYQSYFRDISTEEGDRRTFFLTNTDPCRDRFKNTVPFGGIPQKIVYAYPGWFAPAKARDEYCKLADGGGLSLLVNPDGATYREQLIYLIYRQSTMCSACKHSIILTSSSVFKGKSKER